jgi:hypothetical protein
VTLVGLTVMSIMGLLAASALSWMAWLTVLSLLTIQSSDTFLALRSGTVSIIWGGGERLSLRRVQSVRQAGQAYCAVPANHSVI